MQPNRSAVVSAEGSCVVAEFQNGRHRIDVSDVVHQRQSHRLWRFGDCGPKQDVQMIAQTSDSREPPIFLSFSPHQ